MNTESKRSTLSLKDKPATKSTEGKAKKPLRSGAKYAPKKPNAPRTNHAAGATAPTGTRAKPQRKQNTR